MGFTNGTAAGTHELTNISGANSVGLHPIFLTVFNNEVLFNGFDAAGNFSFNLWVTDGTAAGTYELNSGGADPTVFNNEVLFNGRDAAGHNGLWVTDGTAAGTFEIT